MAQTQSAFPAPQMIGQFRTFGLFGPAYCVLAADKQTASGDWLLRIQVVETGEKTDYPYTQALNDPEAN